MKGLAMSAQPILTDKEDVVTYLCAGRIVEYKKSKLTIGKAVKLKCIDCCGGETKGDYCPRECHISDCPLFPYRMGKGFKLNLTPEQKAKRVEQAKTMVEMKRQQANVETSNDRGTHLNSHRTPGIPIDVPKNLNRK